MIKTFRCRKTAALFEGKFVKEFVSFVHQAERRLQILDNAKILKDLAGLPSNRLETLSGNRKGQYSIRVNQQWRLCFEWREGDAYNVEIVDYH